MLNIPENSGTSDFSGKALAYFMRRNKALGIHLAHGRIGDVAQFYVKAAQREELDDKYVQQWGTVAAALHALIEMKVNQIEEISNTLKKERYDSLDEAHALFRDSMRLSEEIVPLKEKLLEMAAYG